MTYNIRAGGHGRESRLAAVIAQAAPDVVLLQEATDPAVVESLADRTSMPWRAAHAGHSVAAIARLDVTHHAWHRPRWMKRAVLEVRLRTPQGREVRVFGVHLSAWHTTWTERWRTAQLRSLLRYLRAQTGPHLVAGDFNTLAPGEVLDAARLPPRLRALLWLSGARIRWRTIAAMLKADYVDVFRHVHPREPGATFPTWDPHLRLDFVFADARTAHRVAACEVLTTAPAPRASDHFPLVVSLLAHEP